MGKLEQDLGKYIEGLDINSLVATQELYWQAVMFELIKALNIRWLISGGVIKEPYFSPSVKLVKGSGGFYIDIHLTPTDVINIQGRPAHCNRGRFLVNVFNTQPVTPFFIDHADCFPRYYFGIPAMISEIKAWIEAHTSKN